jgi:tetratricopeptide (TPR) repeat protein
MKKWLLRIVWVLFLGIVAAVGLYFIPPVHEKLAWRVENLSAQVRDALNPPEKAVFVPKQSARPAAQIVLPVAPAGATSRPSETPTPAATSLPGETSTPTIPPTASVPLTQIPSKVFLNGIVHEYQGWNNCGPATLAMALTFWGWKGDQTKTAPVLKPNSRDKNVMPYEMLDYVTQQTDFKAVLRVGGDLELLKRLIAGGFPVVVEKGFEVSGEGWMGHYEAVVGYDDGASRFSAEDAYAQKDDNTPLTVPYTDMLTSWRAFNFVYLVIYPADREPAVLSILGPQADEQANYQYAAKKASDEIPALTGRDLYFAWYNRGSSLVSLQDYAGAAAAFDQAFTMYPDIPEKKRPWRMLWYQTGPYFAYFNTGRYLDVINLASTTVGTTSEPALEESFVWRARAEAAAGNNPAAIDDLHTALKWHPGYTPALDELANLGAAP